MSGFGEADWATPGNTASVTEKAATSTGAAGASTILSSANAEGGGYTATGSGPGRCYIIMLSIFNIGLSAMMGALGVLSIITMLLGQTGTSISDLFLSIYMVLFATLLFCYELIWFTPIASINIIFRKNFGFLYGLRGKGFYLIFIAFLTIGLINDDKSTVAGLDWATGIAWLFSGFLHIFISCAIPGSNDLYKPPTVGLSTIGADASPNNV